MAIEKFCVDCKHLGRTAKSMHLVDGCMRPIGGVSAVTGRRLSLHRPCYAERKNNWFRTTCGPDGRFFEPRED